MATNHGCHGGMKMGGLDFGHPNHPIGGLNSGLTSGFPLGEPILLGEFIGCPPFDG
jgi:hypothetical protein